MSNSTYIEEESSNWCQEQLEKVLAENKELKKRLENLWKDAQGDDLPEIDREVIAFQGRKVVIAHRPNHKGWDGKSLSTGEISHYTPKTYDKGGWNMPDVKYWLDAPLPEGIE